VALVEYSDPDFRLCRLTFDDLVGLQRRAEELEWGTRWSSESALRTQLRDEPVLLMTFMRQQRAGNYRSMRCAVLAALAQDSAGCIVTLDVEPERLASLGDAVLDPGVRHALFRIFQLGLSGIEVASKD
jgi:hypothetical protein